MSGKVREKSGNLIMTGQWQPCFYHLWDGKMNVSFSNKIAVLEVDSIAVC